MLIPESHKEDDDQPLAQSVVSAAVGCANGFFGSLLVGVAGVVGNALALVVAGQMLIGMSI
jgi:hypothetical protein